MATKVNFPKGVELRSTDEGRFFIEKKVTCELVKQSEKPLVNANKTEYYIGTFKVDGKLYTGITYASSIEANGAMEEGACYAGEFTVEADSKGKVLPNDDGSARKPILRVSALVKGASAGLDVFGLDDLDIS